MLIPIPSKEETHNTVQPTRTGTEKERWLKWYLDCPNWKCEVCEAVMFGRCIECVYCRIRLNIGRPRPSSYVETPYEKAI